ncbi:MAG: leucyl aminopeptidase [Candidatus Gastranaerophilaceae bacterium]
MEFKVISDVKTQECDILIVNMFECKKTSSDLANDFAIEQDKFEGKFNTTYLLPTYGKQPAKKVLVVGLGKENELNNNKVREAVAKATKKALQMKAKTIAYDFSNISFDYADMISEGTMIGDYAFDKYKTEKKDHIETVYVNLDKSKIEKGLKRAQAMELTRNIANEPAEYATPTKLAEIAKSLGLDTKIYDRKDCEKMGMGAFLAVARGSHQDPKFIHMKYAPKNPTKKIAIIGKGLCFDSGGMDLKPASSMLTMRDDMSGAACILGVMSKLKEFAPNVEVHGIIAACENMIGPNAYKPGDILTAKNGKTIEIDNTDAEGRVTLADALCYACELGVDEVIDIATLTGACMVALGTHASGIMGNNEELVKRIIEVGAKSGEKYWEMPMFDEYFDSMKSDIADMKNTGSRWGGTSAAGLFLKKFVTDSVKWAHLDVAGTAFLDKPQKEFIAGATGVGVRTLLNYIIEA